MKQCKNGHFYDDSKNQNCPLCKDLSTDYEGKCGNCHKYIGEDEYCRYCGTKRGEGKFEPYENFMPCVYGSPNTYIHKCQKCGTEFKSSGMGSNPRYCYKCGSDSISEELWDEKSLKRNIILGDLSVHAIQGHGSETTIFNYATYTVKNESWFYSNGKSSKRNEEIKIPDSITTIDKLVAFVRKEKPMWSLNLYATNYGELSSTTKYSPYPNTIIPPIPPQNFVTVDPIDENSDKAGNVMGMMRPPEPPLMGQIAPFPIKDNKKTLDPKDNIMPCIYGSPGQMSGIYRKKKGCA